MNRSLWVQLGVGAVGIVLLALCCSVCAIVPRGIVAPELTRAREMGTHFLQLLERGDFHAAEQHIVPAARAQYNAATLQQRWKAIETHLGAVRRIVPRQARLELQGHEGWMSLEYDLIGERDVGRVRMEVETKHRTPGIRRLEFAF